MLPPGQIAPLEPADFVIAASNETRVLIDQASLLPADNIDGMDPEMIAMSRELKTPIVRFGGNFTSAYHWKDGIGPRDQRVSMLNTAWGIPEYNQFGTDEFLRFCQLIGAEPQIALNLGTGTPQEAADWVQYVNAHWADHPAACCGNSATNYGAISRSDIPHCLVWRREQNHSATPCEKQIRRLALSRPAPTRMSFMTGTPHNSPILRILSITFPRISW